MSNITKVFMQNIESLCSDSNVEILTGSDTEILIESEGLQLNTEKLVEEKEVDTETLTEHDNKDFGDTETLVETEASTEALLVDSEDTNKLTLLRELNRGNVFQILPMVLSFVKDGFDSKLGQIFLELVHCINWKKDNRVKFTTSYPDVVLNVISTIKTDPFYKDKDVKGVICIYAEEDKTVNLDIPNTECVLAVFGEDRSVYDKSGQKYFCDNGTCILLNSENETLRFPCDEIFKGTSVIVLIVFS